MQCLRNCSLLLSGADKVVRHRFIIITSSQGGIAGTMGKYIDKASKIISVSIKVISLLTWYGTIDSKSHV